MFSGVASSASFSGQRRCSPCPLEFTAAGGYIKLSTVFRISSGVCSVSLKSMSTNRQLSSLTVALQRLCEFGASVETQKYRPRPGRSHLRAKPEISARLRVVTKRSLIGSLPLASALSSEQTNTGLTVEGPNRLARNADPGRSEERRVGKGC